MVWVLVLDGRTVGRVLIGVVVDGEVTTVAYERLLRLYLEGGELRLVIWLSSSKLISSGRNSMAFLTIAM